MYLHRLFVTVATFLLSLTSVHSSAVCDTFTFEGTGQEYPFTKLSILGYSTSYSYVQLPPGEEPYLKILRATEAPTLEEGDNGLLTISPETGACKEVEEPTNGETDSESAANMAWMAGGVLGALMKPTTGISTLLVLLATTLPSGVLGDAHTTCTPKLEIEISVPAGATATEKFGKSIDPLK